jgi:hypothetical protein
MTTGRIRHGGCSFEIPEGYALQSLAEPDGEETPLGVCLLSTRVHPDVPDISESPRDMTPRAYPTSITLTPLLGQRAFPLAYLRNTEAVLQRHFERFAIDFCESDSVGEQVAARSQSSFDSGFRVYRLTYAWLLDKELLMATMMVSEEGVHSGWEELRRFVQSVRLEIRGFGMDIDPGSHDDRDRGQRS